MSFYFATQTDNRIPFGACLENIVYNYAKNKGYRISIGKIGKFECDFIFRNSITEDYSYAQVCYMMTGQEETEEREYRPLESITDNYLTILFSGSCVRTAFRQGRECYFFILVSVSCFIFTPFST